uniref:Uncharacterized protein n=1 Tax=Aegilops tauschii TaxID=37682 RepID=M8BBI0_AEGTA
MGAPLRSISNKTNSSPREPFHKPALTKELGGPDDEGGGVGAGESEAGEEGEHGVGISGGLEVGELGGQVATR